MENLSSCTNIRTLKLCGNQVRCGAQKLKAVENLYFLSQSRYCLRSTTQQRSGSLVGSLWWPMGS